MVAAAPMTGQSSSTGGLRYPEGLPRPAFNVLLRSIAIGGKQGAGGVETDAQLEIRLDHAPEFPPAKLDRV